MKLVECLNCKKLIGHEKGPQLCNKCDSFLFDVVKNYLSEHKGASAKEVSKETKISLAIINEYINDERLIIKQTPIEKNTCTVCGKEIGINEKYCNLCKKKMNFINQAKELKFQEKPKEKEKSKNNKGMYFIDKKVRK